MKHRIFRPLGTLFCSALLLGALSAPAQAADITVKVDDQPVAFTDARPLLRGDRTYVPFRAIFEQMDAAVEWDGATQTVTASRGGRSVRFQIGQTTMTLTEDGRSRTETTDAAPFVEGGRTYVPVRFASEAFGACVDWVQSTQTVLIVDVDALVDETYAASFSRMDAYLDFASPDSARTLSGDFTLDMQYKAAMGSLPVKLTGTAAGSAGRMAAELAGSAALDVQALRDAIAANEGADVISSEVESLLQSLANSSYRAVFSRENGALYLSGALACELGAETDGWLSIPFETFAGRTLGGLLAAPADGSFAEYAALCAQQTDLEAAPEATVQTVRAVLTQMQAAYGDSAFTLSDGQAALTVGGYTLTLSYGADGAVERALLRGTSQQDGASYTAQLEQETSRFALTLALEGGETADLSLRVTLSSAAGGSAPDTGRLENVTAWQ